MTDGTTYQIRKTFDPRTFSVIEELVPVDGKSPRKPATKKVAAPKPKPVKASKAAKSKKARGKKKSDA